MAALLPGRAGAEVDRSRDHGRLAAMDADTLGRGALQVQLLSEGSRAPERWDLDGRTCHRADASWHRAALALVAGAGDRLDLSLELPWEWTRDPEDAASSGSGAGGAAAGAKWRIRDGAGGGPDVAVLPALSLSPAGDGEGRDLTGGVAAALVWDIGPGAGVNLDAGWSRSLDGETGGAGSSWRLAGALGWRTGFRLAPSLELVHEQGRAPGERGSRLTSLVAGAGWAALPDVTLRAGIWQDLAGRHVDRCTRILLALEVQL